MLSATQGIRMRHASKVFVWTAAVVLFTGLAPAEQKVRPSYLAPGVVNMLEVLPPAPVPGDPRYESDREMFKMTRKLQGTPRWALATNDVSWANDIMLHNFSCAMGVDVTSAKAPKLVALLQKAGGDTQRETNVAKNFYKRARPFRIDAGPICQPESDLADSYDYPSGHTTGGWTWALVLADVVSDHASAILARGRAYGESRIVCGAHNASAVEAGRLSATITMTAVRSTAAYQRDLKAARAEMAALRKTAAAAPPAICDAEKALIAQSIYTPAP
jgi:acid phosphatase (class A)